MRIACWITKAAGTHSEYVTVIDFPRQEWLCERASLLRYGTLPVLLEYINILKQYSEGPATGHLNTDFSWFPCA